MRENLDLNNLPRHVAVIMDGNGRWAKKKGAERIFGHQSAIKSVKDVTEGCAELGVEYLTLYAFSTENWKRPKLEVDGLMRLLVSSLRKELDTLQKNEVKLSAIGDLQNLPRACQKELKEAMENTRHNNRMQLTLALSYSGRWELVQAVKKLIAKAKQGLLEESDITEQMIAEGLETNGIPDPELLIRTSGEMRISNFLLWQIAYTELYITEVLWPDFRKEHLYQALMAYQSRERRFGKISEQVNS
ncbi:MAG: isoprenyl transferase [Cyclobacteriaceae bacterium]|nr:MAG: isoprenyl transferase [Cyclobacteriaceae bacterium]